MAKWVCRARAPMRTIKEEEVNSSDSVNDADALKQIGRFLDEVSMHQRIYCFLG